MPRLLSINNYHYRRGGAEVVCLESAALLSDVGWEVVPFAMRHPLNLPSPWSDYFVTEIEHGSGYSLIEQLIRVPKVIYSLEARARIGKLIQAARPDIAHAHNIYHHLSPSIFGVLRRAGIPVVLTLHDLKLACPAYKMLTHDGVCERCRGGRIWNVARHRCIKGSRALSLLIALETAVHRLFRLYANQVDRFVVPSRFYLEKMVEWGWDRQRFVHIPNFVDVARWQPESQPGRDFVYAGRLGHEKGLKTLIRAVALSGVRLRIAGTGPEEQELRALAATCGAEVEFCGYLTGDSLHAVMRASRALVLPSEWYENAPISVLEAYALGRPVIGAAIGGIPELIQPEVTGATFPSGDVEALAFQLRRVADLPDAELRRMGVAARRFVEAGFTPAQHRDRLLALYHSLAGSSLGALPDTPDASADSGH